VVYAKRPFGGPEHVLRYLGSYTHRVAISNHRLVSFADEKVTFRWRDSAHKNKKRLMTLPVEEFLRRFLLHLLPKGFVRIRHFGFLHPAAHRPVADLKNQSYSENPTPCHSGIARRRQSPVIFEGEWLRASSVNLATGCVTCVPC